MIYDKERREGNTHVQNKKKHRFSSCVWLICHRALSSGAAGRYEASARERTERCLGSFARHPLALHFFS